MLGSKKRQSKTSAFLLLLLTAKTQSHSIDQSKIYPMAVLQQRLELYKINETKIKYNTF